MKVILKGDNLDLALRAVQTFMTRPFQEKDCIFVYGDTYAYFVKRNKSSFSSTQFDPHAGERQ